MIIIKIRKKNVWFVCLLKKSTKYYSGSYWKKNGGFSLLLNLFRSRFEKLESDPRVLTREPLAATTTATIAASTSLSSPSWFTAIFAGRMKKKSWLFVYDESTVEKKPRLRADWGMLPVRTGDSNEDCECSPLVWFSRKCGSRNFFSNIIFSRKKNEFILYNWFVILLI